MADSKLVIIDGHAILYRAWHALPFLKTKTGEVTNAVYGFMLVFFKILKELKPNYLVVAFDVKKPTFRHQIFKEYKAQRIKQPKEFYAQLNRVKEILKSLKITYLEKSGYEADDIIATITNFSLPTSNIIVTGDLDTLQLVDEKTKVYTFKRGVTDAILYDQKIIQEKFGLLSRQLLDFKALRGDPADNISGAKGIGEKTALKLIQKFHSLENLYQNLEKIEDKRVREILQKNEAQVFLSKKLINLKRDLEIKFNLEQLKLTQPNTKKLVKIFQALEFKSLLPKVLNLFKEKVSEKFLPIKNVQQQKEKYYLIDSREKFDRFFTLLSQQKIFALDTETTSLNPFSACLLGVSFAWQIGKAYYLPVVNNQLLITKYLKPILESPQIKKIGHHLKYDLAVLETYGLKLQGLDFDTMIAAYLLNPGARAYGLDLLVFSEFGYQMTNLESLIGEGKKQIPIESVPLEKIFHYACQDVDYTFRLAKKLKEKLISTGKLFSLFQKIEMPLISVLAKMERYGVKIDEKVLENLQRDSAEKLKSLQKKIYQLADTSFNINSPQQLKEVLFQKLKISTKGLSQTKTGISTAATELKKLKGRHQIIDFIFQYRELSKLKSTYLETLPKLVNQKTGRLHTNFNQTITATGRLSSSEPNLQNIPVRSTFGRKIRQAFVAENGYQLVSVDYSQIELRIAASLAGEQRMIESFKRDEDIHTKTAAEIKGISFEKVTPILRRLAKMINFGIIYGLGIQGLAEGANISREEAESFIQKYFTVYPALKKYIEWAKKIVRRNGYAETLFGRRRYLPDINSPIQVLKAEAERMAINLPIQGLASDLIKIAMLEIDKKTSSFKEEVKMILQVHDELIFEVKNERVKELIKIIKEVIERPPVKLLVPIKAEVKIGKNWGELKNF